MAGLVNKADSAQGGTAAWPPREAGLAAGAQGRTMRDPLSPQPGWKVLTDALTDMLPGVRGAAGGPGRGVSLRPGC